MSMKAAVIVLEESRNRLAEAKAAEKRARAAVRTATRLLAEANLGIGVELAKADAGRPSASGVAHAPAG